MVGSTNVFLHHTVVDNVDNKLYNALTLFNAATGAFVKNILSEQGTASLADPHRVVIAKKISSVMYKVMQSSGSKPLIL